jgi:uncharacterized protein with GYD domain
MFPATAAPGGEERSMPRYMIQAAYTPAAAAAFASNPQERTSGVRALVEKAGGTLESFDFCLGEYDVVVLANLPGDAATAAMALAVSGAGHVSKYRTQRLMPEAEFLEAQRMAHGFSYKAPAKA